MDPIRKKRKKLNKTEGRIGRVSDGVEGQVNESDKVRIIEEEKMRRQKEAERQAKKPVRLEEESDARQGDKRQDAARKERGEKKKTFWSGLTSELNGDVYRIKGGIDRPMLIIILVLICFGSVMVFSASYAYALSDTGDSYFFIKKQIGYVVAGILVMLAMAIFVDYRWIRWLTPLYFAGSTLLLLAVLVIGVAEGDAKRWLVLGPISFQPSETMKLGLVLMLAWYYSLTEKQVRAKGFWKSSFFGTFIPLFIVGFVCVLIALEKHISGTFIMFAIGMVVIFVAGGKLIWFAGAMGVFGVAVAFIISFTDYATKRLDIWLHPENYSVQSEVWQTLQGLYAVGSGGWFGVGLGNSRQKHLFVSQPQNDFIFSIVCEELGLIGAAFVIVLFVAFVWRGVIIAKRAPDTFSKLTVVGIVSKVAIQAFLNIAVVTNTIPNTGISLPFFSYGGTALLILFLEMGVLLAISRYSYLQKK